MTVFVCYCYCANDCKAIYKTHSGGNGRVPKNVFYKGETDMTKREWRRRFPLGLSAMALSIGLMGGCTPNTPPMPTPTSPVSTEDGTGSEEATSATEETTKEEYVPEPDVALDVTPVSVIYKAEGAAWTEEASVFVEPVEGISDDFMYGADISSVLSLEKAGVKFYDSEGNEQDLFRLLADGGVNYIRVRVWNDPFDSKGNGYGGGNCDAAVAAEIGRRAAQYGMKLCVDFHYSDFWADPNKQMVPKAWKVLPVSDMEKAIYAYTRNSLVTILNAGADVGMVQIGNEINYGMSGLKDWTKKCKLLVKASEAVREVSKISGKDILIAIHLTEVAKENEITNACEVLKNNGVDYDVMALSYYMFWHGTLENLKSVMRSVIDDYGKKVVVAETSYIYIDGDGDGTGNSVDSGSLAVGYTASLQGQVNAVRDVCEAVNEMGSDGLGVFYWEPAWIPVNHYDWEAEGAAAVLEENRKAWEEFGAGWASSYAADYDRDDAGQYYGGSSWDNQAWFDFDGKAMDSLYTYRWLRYGTACPLAIDAVDDIDMQLNVGDEFTVPATTLVHYNDRSKNTEIPVTWDEAQLAAVNTSADGEYDVTGTVEGGFTVNLHVSVQYVNYVLNPSFEDEDRSMWVITPALSHDPSDFQKKAGDAKTGEYSLHFWDSADYAFTCEQTLTGLENGNYYFSVCVQGGDVNDSAEMYIYVKDASGNEIARQTFMVDGWVNWKTPEIDGIEVTDGTLTIGASIKGNKNSWGTIDDFYLCRKPGGD